jgi:serine/threonine protein kinase
MPEVFEHEVQILRSLRHPNIVLFMGVSINDTKRFIVTELMPGKSLDIMIHKHSKRITNKYHNALTFDRKVDLLLDVIRGMQYLHSLQPAIVHRDLKPSNILVRTNCSQLTILVGQTLKHVQNL